MHDSADSAPETTVSSAWPAPPGIDESDIYGLSGPAIPAQWLPGHDLLPATAEPTTAEPAVDPAMTAPPRKSRRGLVIALIAILVGAAAIVVLPFGSRTPSANLGAAPAAAASVPPAPYDLAVKALQAQATALLRHDHAGWMAAVDPKQPALRKHFEQLYSTFQALHVSQFEYQFPNGSTSGAPVQIESEMVFCLSQKTCPSLVAGREDGASHIPAKLTLKQLNGRWTIVKSAKGSYQGDLEPYPWEAGDMVFAQGSRVVVGAPKSLAGQLKTVLAVADKAARTDDRFAGMVGNPQLRYRVFLATDKAWKTWYGGNDASYAVAYTIPTGSAGSDVVLHMPKLEGDRQELKVVLQHEMGHVATLSNLTTGDDGDLWLMEGVADYIGWLPQHTHQDWNFPDVRNALHGSHPPRSIVETPLKNDASDTAVARFYGLGHFAVECLATKYGEARTMNFVRLKLREGYDLDGSSQQAFGTPFKTVDKGCVTWMKQHS
jgi:hypothetical protein